MRLLIVGSLEGYISSAAKIAIDRGAKVGTVDDVPQAMDALRSGQGADMLMVDVKYDIAGLVDSLKGERINVPVVACGIGTDTQAAVRAIHAGAKEYIPLPPDAQLIAAVLEAVAEESHSIVSSDPAMSEVLRLADRIAPSDAGVLITGESGTGKELMSRYIHRKSKRSKGPFVAVNCAAIPDDLLESELFGHEKGAFTGAVARRQGKFEEAGGGTLLLDEISEMDARLQAKLLRAVQEREVTRLGSNQPVKVDVRILATSNRDIGQAVERGEFREDLFYRLNVVNIDIPPLRERPLDIAVLAEHFVKKYAEANGEAPRPISGEALEKLKAHDWRGNVRELENTMYRAVLLAQGPEIGAEAILLTGAGLAGRGTQGDQPAAKQEEAKELVAEAAAQREAAQAERPAEAEAAGDRAEAGATEDAESQDAQVAQMVGRTVADVERELIISTLDHCLGNRTHAANILGISIRTLRNKLKQYSQEGVAIPGSQESQDSPAAR